MKIRIKKFLSIILLLFLLLMSNACNPTKQVLTNKNQYIDYQEFPIEKLDSICFSDSISNILNDWHRIDVKEYESKYFKTKYMYIKILNDSCNLIYIIEDNKISKRKIFEQ